jgi:quercetin dioxygenase-like cupin family protein
VEIRHPQPSQKAGAPRFIGDVWFNTIARGEGESRIRVTTVRFNPGARSAWHSHAVGQTLYVTEGVALVQSRGEDVVRLRAGDVAHTPGGEWHWHGADGQHFMSHLSVTEAPSDPSVEETVWGDPVGDDEYPG